MIVETPFKSLDSVEVNKINRTNDVTVLVASAEGSEVIFTFRLLAKSCSGCLTGRRYGKSGPAGGNLKQHKTGQIDDDSDSDSALAGTTWTSRRSC